VHIVLVNPLIPQNTGSIARLAAGTESDLHLVGRLGFSLSDPLLKRAGLDYWPNVRLHLHRDFDELLERYPPPRIALLSSHASRPYSDFRASPDAWLVFGQETTGLPAELRQRYANDLYKIPITRHVRYLNLATAVAVVVYDGLRQLGFPSLS
jgi:tRNA (cytidine/uridine-2'-O-)-methyltransferase